MEKEKGMTYLLIALAVGVLAYSAASFFVQPDASGFRQQTATNQLASQSSGSETYQQMMARMHPGQQIQQAASNTHPNSPVVSINYVGYFENGTVFDTNLQDIAVKANISHKSYAPLRFALGAGQVVRGLDAGVQAMSVGETRTLKITPDIGFGERLSQLVYQVPIAKLEAMNITPVVGMHLYTQNGLAGTVLNFTGNNATVDFNNPLAGMTFYMNVTLLSKN